MLSCTFVLIFQSGSDFNTAIIKSTVEPQLYNFLLSEQSVLCLGFGI